MSQASSIKPPGAFLLALEGRAPWEFGTHAPVDIVVRVAPRLAWQAERTFGRRAAVTREKDGSVVVRFAASDTSAAIRWALSLGRAAAILAPASVRASARETLRELAARHRGAMAAGTPAKRRAAPRAAKQGAR